MAIHATIIQSIATKQLNKIFGGLIWFSCFIIAAFSISKTSQLKHTLTYWMCKVSFMFTVDLFLTVEQGWSLNKKDIQQKTP